LRLSLGSCQIGDEGAQALASALVVNTSLQRLELQDCSIGDVGAAALGAALEACELSVLDLTNNDFGDEGIGVLANGLALNKSIAVLNLGGNSFGLGGVAALRSALATNHHVLRLRYIPFLQQPDELVDAYLARNRMLYMQGAAKGFALELMNTPDPGLEILAFLLDAADVRAALYLGALNRATRRAVENELERIGIDVSNSSS
jgi:hypothetical protein